MNRRDAFKTIAGVSALAVTAENAIAEPSQADMEKVRKTLDNSEWAGKAAPAWINRLSHADYDRLHVDAGREIPEQSHMFAMPIGYPMPGHCDRCDGPFTSRSVKTALWTNMLRGNSIPPPQSRVVERIVFLFSPAMSKEDRNQLVSKSYWEFRLDEKIVGRAPLAWSPIEGELFDLFEFDGKMPKRLGRNDRKLSPGQYVHLAKPVYIAPLQYFGFELRTEPFVAKNDIDMYVLLDGTGDFPVQ